MIDMARRRSYTKTVKKRTLSEEQLAKMKEGRERKARQKKQVEMLSELDERLKQGRRASESDKSFKISKRRRRYGF